MDITKYPKDLDENIKFRANLLKDCERDVDLQMAVNELCSRDILLWIDLFCWTKDPRRVAVGMPAMMPFICYDFQTGYVKGIEKAIDEQYDEATEKTRDMGVSWAVLYVLLHKWKYEDGSDFRIGSRKQEFVDLPKVVDTLFEKCRVALEHLPIWMLPKGYDWRGDSTFMKLHNPELGNTIIGESANEDFGSGGRSKAVFMDEFAKWDLRIAEAAWTAREANRTGRR